MSRHVVGDLFSQLEPATIRQEDIFLLKYGFNQVVASIYLILIRSDIHKHWQQLWQYTTLNACALIQFIIAQTRLSSMG